MTIALLFSSNTCIVQIQSVRVNFACTKRLFNLSAEAIINVRNARLYAGCAIILLTIRQILVSGRFATGFTFLKRVRNQIRMLLEMSIVLVKYCVNREKCESLDGDVTTPGSVYGCQKCRVWLFINEVRFMLQEHLNLKTTKTDKTRFFFAKKI